MANNLNWHPVSVNFSDASAFMRNAGDSISKAGTVFGELRKSILDEEQRAIENAYKEKQMAESIRQFNERLGFEQSKWGDEKVLKELEQKETHRHNEASERNQAASVDIQRMAQQFQEAKWQEEQRQLREQANVYGTYLNNRILDERDSAAYSTKRRNEIGEYDTAAALAQNEVNQYTGLLQQNPDADTAAVLEAKKADAQKRLDYNNMVRQAWAENNPEPVMRNNHPNTLVAGLDLIGQLAQKGVNVDLSKTPLGPLIASGMASSSEEAKSKREHENKMAEIYAEQNAKIRGEMAKIIANQKPLTQLMEEEGISTAFEPDVKKLQAVARLYTAKHGLPTPTAKEVIDMWKSAYGVERNFMDLIGTFWQSKTPAYAFKGRRAYDVTLKDLENPLTDQLSTFKTYLDSTRKK